MKLPSHCPSCGNQVGESDRFCGKCGRALVDESQTGSSQPADQNYRPLTPSTPTPPTQPQYGDVSNHLVWAILVTLFCCLPAGIVAIVYSAQVNGALENGDIERARRLSENAKLWIWISLGIGIALGFLFIVLPFLGAFGIDFY